MTTEHRHMTLKDWRMLAIVGWVGWTFQYFIQWW
jgi:hypothetical protein